MTYDPERHHRHSIWLKDYDYAEAGAYFVTVCIERRECLLGDVVDGQMAVNDWGRIAGEVWEQIAEHWPTVDLDVSIVMPNHTHGIVILRDKGQIEEGRKEDGGNRGKGRDEEEGGGTPPLRGQMKPTLGAIVAYWKCQTSKQINAARQTPGTRVWQRNFHDRIIRNEEMLNNMRAYITHNPARWGEDADNPVNA